ncbi:MAG TPA: aconitase X catalytic domain-containing protein [Nitrososphaeraceae archaeon]|nr:aconitase X catalytic domain-containing protein [Nitrososphaeraceae archaeon]
MELTKQEDMALKGEYGEGLEISYKILVAIGNANNASKLIPIKWAHISGVNFNTIGEAGVKFLSSLDKKNKVTVTTTLNPMGFDSKKDNNLSDYFKSNQISIINSYLSLGIKPSFTCIPYEIFDLPSKGEVVSFAESNAAVFVNSILGIKTNKESALSSLASAITGKTPYSDLLIDELRKPKVSIQPEIKVETELDFGLLGYFAGKITNESCIGLETNFENLDIVKSKALSAGIGTSGRAGMFNNTNNKDCERVSFGKTELDQVKDDLNTSEKGELIVFGSPQLGIDELNLLVHLTEGKKFRKPCKIFCPRSVTEMECNNEIIKKLRNAGADIICDSCTCLTPLITKNDYDSIVTNSIKCAYYMKHSNKIDVSLKDMETITKEYCE